MTDTGRRRRLSSGETRERMVAAGLDALARDGLALGLDTVNLEQAVRDAEVSRSSAYAAWSTDDEHSPQELFQRTVLKQAVLDRRDTIEQTMRTAFDIIDRLGADAPPRRVLHELVREAAGQNARLVAESRSWQVVIALQSALNSSPPDRRDDELADWVSTTEEQYRNEAIETFYRPFVELLGLRPKPEFGDAAFHYGEIAGSALVEGLGSRHFMRTADYLDGIKRAGPDGTVEDWTLYAVVFEQLIWTFFEPIDPATWEAW